MMASASSETRLWPPASIIGLSGDQRNWSDVAGNWSRNGHSRQPARRAVAAQHLHAGTVVDHARQEEHVAEGEQRRAAEPGEIDRDQRGHRQQRRRGQRGDAGAASGTAAPSQRRSGVNASSRAQRKQHAGLLRGDHEAGEQRQPPMFPVRQAVRREQQQGQRKDQQRREDVGHELRGEPRQRGGCGQGGDEGHQPPGRDGRQQDVVAPGAA